MTSRINRRIVLLRRPEGLPRESDFGLEEVSVEDPTPGTALIEVEHLSIDPFIRAALNEGSAHPAVSLCRSSWMAATSGSCFWTFPRAEAPMGIELFPLVIELLAVGSRR